MNFEAAREFLKSNRWEEWRRKTTDQRRGIPPPIAQKPAQQGSPQVDLVPHENLSVGRVPLLEILGKRRSRRQYTDEPLNLEELSFLLWATQGVDMEATEAYREWLAGKVGEDKGSIRTVLRTVPSAGARHPFETYLIIQRVREVQQGLYRYLPFDHRITLVRGGGSYLQEEVRETFSGWIACSALIFIWTVVPYVTEWRYTMVSHKMIAQESGHICQNLYLACEAIGAGTCAVGGYDQEKVDALLPVDGLNEFAIYVAPVGKVSSSQAYHFDH